MPCTVLWYVIAKKKKKSLCDLIEETEHKKFKATVQTIKCSMISVPLIISFLVLTSLRIITMEVIYTIQVEKGRIRDQEAQIISVALGQSLSLYGPLGK